MILLPAALVCSSLLWQAEVTTVHPTHFLFSTSTSKFRAPKIQVGIAIRSKRISHPHEINVERSGTDLGARATLRKWSLEVSCTDLHGCFNLGPNLIKICPERSEILLILTGLTVRTGITKGEELCREPEMLWGFALSVQWPQSTFMWQLVGCDWGTGLGPVSKPGGSIKRNLSAAALVWGLMKFSRKSSAQRQNSSQPLRGARQNWALVLLSVSWLWGWKKWRPHPGFGCFALLRQHKPPTEYFSEDFLNIF